MANDVKRNKCLFDCQSSSTQPTRTHLLNNLLPTNPPFKTRLAVIRKCCCFLFPQCARVCVCVYVGTYDLPFVVVLIVIVVIVLFKYFLSPVLDVVFRLLTKIIIRT